MLTLEVQFWSEKILVKVKILKKGFRHSVVFSGQALMIYLNWKFRWKNLVTLSIFFNLKVLVLKKDENPNKKWFTKTQKFLLKWEKNLVGENFNLVGENWFHLPNW